MSFGDGLDAQSSGCGHLARTTALQFWARLDCASAAREIKALIGSSVERVDAGSRLVKDAGGTMAEIVSSVHRVSQTIGEITEAAGEQSEGLGEVNSAVAELDRMTQQNAALVEQGAAAAATLHDQARQLALAVAHFRLGEAMA